MTSLFRADVEFFFFELHIPPRHLQKGQSKDNRADEARKPVSARGGQLFSRSVHLQGGTLGFLEYPNPSRNRLNVRGVLNALFDRR